MVLSERILIVWHIIVAIMDVRLKTSEPKFIQANARQSQKAVHVNNVVKKTDQFIHTFYLVRIVMALKSIRGSGQNYPMSTN